MGWQAKTELLHTFRASATLRTASVAAPPLAAKPETRCLRGGIVPPTVPSGALAAGAKLSPASHDAYDPVFAVTLVSSLLSISGEHKSVRHLTDPVQKLRCYRGSILPPTVPNRALATGARLFHASHDA